MSSSAHTLFLQAGLALYPDHGYHQLSVRQLAAEAGLSAGMFHHLFASKDDFVGQLLRHKYNEGFAQLVMQLPAAGSVRDKLYAALLLIARFVRANLPWVRRIFADSANGAECVNDFIRHHGSRHVTVLTDLLQTGIDNGELADAALAQYFCFMMGAVIEPLIVAGNLMAANLAPPLIRDQFAEHLASDRAIGQRIDWALDALFSNRQVSA